MARHSSSSSSGSDISISSCLLPFTSTYTMSDFRKSSRPVSSSQPLTNRRDASHFRTTWALVSSIDALPVAKKPKANSSPSMASTSTCRASEWRYPMQNSEQNSMQNRQKNVRVKVKQELPKAERWIRTRPKLMMERVEKLKMFHVYMCQRWKEGFGRYQPDHHTCGGISLMRTNHVKLPEELKKLAGPETFNSKKHCQPHWMLDRSSLSLIRLSYEFAEKNDLPGLITNLFFCVIFMCTESNWKKFGGVTLDEPLATFAQRLADFRPTKKPYDCHRIIAAFATSYKDPDLELRFLREKHRLPPSKDGALCFMHHLRKKMNAFVATFTRDPSPATTAKLLKDLKIPRFPKLIIHRYLGYFEPRCYGPNERMQVGSGAIPTIEWMCGADFQWPEHHHEAYQRRGSVAQHEDMLVELHGHLPDVFDAPFPRWLIKDEQITEHQLCEFRKFATGHRHGLDYVPRCSGCYATLLSEIGKLHERRQDSMLSCKHRSSLSASTSSERNVDSMLADETSAATEQKVDNLLAAEHRRGALSASRRPRLSGRQSKTAFRDQRSNDSVDSDYCLSSEQMTDSYAHYCLSSETD